MNFLVISFLGSLLCALVLICSFGRHARFSGDATSGGPQKYHAKPVPRIGGVAVFWGAVLAAALAPGASAESRHLLHLLLAASLPAFAAGLVEDLTKVVSPRCRLFFTTVAGALGVWLLGAKLVHTGVPALDWLLAFTPLAIAITLFAVAGLSNAINIIDGFNGLASMSVLTMLGAIAFVAFQVGDSALFIAALTLAGAVLGFMFWNYPQGLVFLGDGGAYFLGFTVAELLLLLLVRNPSVSPMFALLLCIYPVFETGFTISRRLARGGTGSTFAPDALHLHSLVHRRLVRNALFARGERRGGMLNAMTAPYLWALCLLSVLPCLMWWNDGQMLCLFGLAFVIAYLCLYRAIVRFRTPHWLRLKQGGPARALASVLDKSA
jgi:UDP-N-acetylmuramyl pentapeptide phosphotransferase/UDP-N-acetylglucosamine-1-phosphate transferase